MSSIEYINSVVLTASATSVEFTSIPQQYNDIFINIGILPVDSLWPAMLMQVGNNTYDTSTNYSVTVLAGNGTSAVSNRLSSQNQLNFSRENGIGTSTTERHIGEYHFLSYSNTNIFKTILESSGNSTKGVCSEVGLWRSTDSINRIKMYVTGGGFNTGSTFTLWGVR